MRRVAAGQRWYEPHRSHFYQRPLALGVGHRPITLGAYLGFLVVAGLAVLMTRAAVPRRLALAAGAAAVFGVAVQVVRGVERARVRNDADAGAEAGASDRRAA
jgi:hypothetical protein